MNANEIVKMLRCFSNCDDTKCHDCAAYEKYCEDHSWKDDYYEIAAGCIEHWVASYEECAKNYQQKCRDISELETENARLITRDTVKMPKPNKRIAGLGECQICKTELCTDDKDLYFCPTCGQRLKPERSEDD